MALNTTYAPVREAGNGSKQDFDFDFEVLSASDLSVGKILNSTNVKTDMVLGVDFTVTLNTVTRKGTVHYTVAPTTLQDSWIGRAVPVTQPTDIPTNNIFREVQVENALDRQAMISQQLEEKIGRALILPDTSDLSDLSLPTPEAGKALKWNPTENGFENSTYDPDIVGNYAAAAEASATAAETAQGAAETAQGLAEDARDIAVAAAGSMTLASQAEAEAGVENTKYLSSLRVKQAIDALQRAVASQAEAEAGADDAKVMTALRTKQAIDAQKPGFGARSGNLAAHTIYRASTDIIVTASAKADSTGDFILNAFSDSNASPSIEIAREFMNGNYENRSSITFTVKKGHYWYVGISGLGGGTIYTHYYTPIGA